MVTDHRLKDFMHYPDLALRIAMAPTFRWTGSPDSLRQGKTLRFFLRLGFLFGAVNIVYQNFGMVIYMVMKGMQNAEDLNFCEIAEVGGIMGLTLVGTCKMCMLYGYERRIQNLLEEFEKMFPNQRFWNYKLFRVEYFLQRSRGLMKSTTMFFLFAFAYYNSAPILELGYELIRPELRFKYRYQSFTWYPWQNDSNQRSMVSFIASYVCQVFSSLSGVAFIMAGEFLLCFFITQIQMHFEYLSSSLEKLDAAAPDANERLKFLLNYHNRLLEHSAEINEIFNLSFLVNFATSSIAICLMGFSMVMISVAHAFKYAVGLMSFLVFTLFICYNGNKFTEASDKLLPAAFYNNWYAGNRDYRRMILIIMIRSRAPNYLRVYKFNTVSMETYMMILKVSYQLFTFFRAMMTVN